MLLGAWAALLASVVVAAGGIVDAVAGGAASVGAPEIRARAPGESAAHSISSISPTASPPPDAGQVDAAPGATQVVSVEIRGGGIRLDPQVATIELTRASGGSLRGRLQAVRVVDARGTLGGWSLVATTDGVVSSSDGSRPAASIRVRDLSVTPFDGEPDGLRPGHDGALGDNATTLASADAGTGGGTYLVDADVVVRPARPVPPTATLVIDLALVAR